MKNKTGLICTILGIFILLAGFSLRSFIHQEEFILKNDLNRRFLSFLYDNNLLYPGLDIGEIYSYNEILIGIQNYSKNKLWGVKLYNSININENIKTKIELNNLLISFLADEKDEKQIREILIKFDPHKYPINHEAIKIALLKNAYFDLRQTLAFIEHHGFLGFPQFFVDGFNAAVRMPAVLLIYKSPVMQKFFQSLILPVIGFIMTAIGSFKLIKNQFS